MMRLVFALLLALPLGGLSAEVPENFKKENLIAWCIVPFDAKKRGPEERAAMVKELGLKKIAYDWRKEHVETFEQEIFAYQKAGLEMFAFWGGHEEAFALFEKHKIQPQVWRTLRAPNGKTQAEKVASAADAMEPLATRTGELGCELGLYNHGGWGGEPENLVAVCEELRKRGHDHVGIVYNFHHAHDVLGNWEKAFSTVKPYLLCLNLNGMVPNGDKEGKKILSLGQGSEEAGMLKTILASGYKGPVGILDHRNETDSKETLAENLGGLEKILTNLSSQ